MRKRWRRRPKNRRIMGISKSRRRRRTEQEEEHAHC